MFYMHFHSWWHDLVNMGFVCLQGTKTQRQVLWVIFFNLHILISEIQIQK